jgi:starvation-inducible DNA-binding protein
MDDNLTIEMKKLLASTFSLYLKAHGFHWNVMGSNFPQYHDFFGEVYEMAHGEVDDIAEQIRQLGSFSPASYDRFSSLTLVADELGIPEPLDMMIKRVQSRRCENARLAPAAADDLAQAPRARDEGLAAHQHRTDGATQALRQTE